MLCTTLCSPITEIEIPNNNPPLLPGVWTGGGSNDDGAKEISFAITEGYVGGEVIWAYTPTEARIFPADLLGSSGSVQAAPAIDSTMELRLGGVLVATITITQNSVEFESDGFTVNIGDTLQLHATDDQMFTTVALSILTEPTE